MIYTGLNRTGEIETVKAHGGTDVAEVYGGINESNPVYYKTRTLTGTLPLSYKALGKPLSDYLISGNTLQDGTPTPSDPVDVVGCGERTGNLFDVASMIPAQKKNAYLNNSGSEVYSATWSYTDFIPCSGTEFVLSVVGGASASICFYDEDKQFIYGKNYGTPNPATKRSIFITVPSAAKFARFSYCYTSTIPENVDDLSKIMLNSGSTAKPYEPYGYNLPLTVNGTEYPIYLGNIQTTRRIRKVAFDGTENWSASGGGDTLVYYTALNASGVPDTTAESICTHLEYGDRYTQGQYDIGESGAMRISAKGLTSLSAFKQFLVDEYSNGTPMTVWYVLAEPETAVVNEPLHKIGDYADTISMAQASVTIPTIAGTNTLTIDTTVQPSEISITGNIKEVST